MSISYSEKQRFSQKWLIILVVIVSLIPLWGLYRQLVQKIPFGNNPISDAALIALSVVMMGISGSILMINLRTEINKDEIKISFFPFANKSIKWSDVKSAEVLDYGFIGGWGLRYSNKYGTAYNTSGSKGLWLNLKSGKKLLIGTQKEMELKKMVSQVDINNII